MTRVRALPFAERLWILWRTAPPVAMRCTRVPTRTIIFFWCRLDEPAAGLDSGYYLVRRSASDGWLWRVEPRHPARRFAWRGGEPVLVGEIGVSDTREQADVGYRARRSALRQLGLDDGGEPTTG